MVPAKTGIKISKTKVKMKFDNLAIKDDADLVFGYAPNPVTTSRGLVIGAGTVYPELNFTLSTMQINNNTLPEIKRQYRKIVEDALERALQLASPGLIFEFETLLEMTRIPSIEIELTKIMNGVCE